MIMLFVMKTMIMLMVMRLMIMIAIMIAKVMIMMMITINTNNNIVRFVETKMMSINVSIVK